MAHSVDKQDENETITVHTVTVTIVMLSSLQL